MNKQIHEQNRDSEKTDLTNYSQGQRTTLKPHQDYWEVTSLGKGRKKKNSTLAHDMPVILTLLIETGRL